MSHHDVFISYAREDRPKVEKLAHSLQNAGLHVWWDPKIQTGSGFRQEITDALTKTKSVIVVWSRNSVASRFVCDEADEGAAREILFPALIDNVDIPLGFRQIQTADLTHWRGNMNDPALKSFVSTVLDGAGGPSPAMQRPPEPAPVPQPAKPETAPQPKRQPKPKKPKQPRSSKKYTTTGSKRRLALFGQSLFLAALVSAAFGALAYTSDFVFEAYRPFFVGAMGVLAFLSRYGTLEADRAAGAASLALLPRSYMALILFSLIAIAPLVLQGRLYAAALEGVQVKGIEGADINKVTFSGDGARIITASDDNIAKVWDARTGVEIGQFSGHLKDCDNFDEDGKPLCWIWGADFAPDGSKAVTASRDLSAQIWTIPMGQMVMKLEGHRSSVYDAAWHPGGEVIATGSSDNTIIIWDPETGDAIRTLNGHTDDVNALDFSPNGEILASASSDGNVRLWNWRNGGRLAALSIGGPGNSVKFSNNGALFAAAADNGRVRVWSTGGRSRVASFDHGAGRAFGVAFVNDDTALATSGIDPVIRIWNIDDQSIIRELEGHSDASRGLDSSSDGMLLVSGSRDNTVRVWDPQTGEELATMGHIDSAIDLPIPLDTPPVFVSSQAPAPVDFKAQPGKAVDLGLKGFAAAFALLLGALILKGLFWLVRLRPLSRIIVVGSLFAVTAYVGLLIASALPAEALALWATLAFLPATAFALFRWIWRSTILANLNKRTRKRVLTAREVVLSSHRLTRRREAMLAPVVNHA